jgi:transposase-like protein
MNIVERARRFWQSLRAMAARSAWDWRRCPHCGDTLTTKWGYYRRRPWFLDGRQTVEVQRHRCRACQKTYSETSALLVSGSWYAREVHRFAVDHWQHVGSSVRRTAEVLRSLMGRQERWLFWRPLAEPPPAEAECHLSGSTVERWLDAAGVAAAETVDDQLAGVSTSGQVATDGLWARLVGGKTRVLMALVDSVTGLIWPPVVAEGEAEADDWEPLFERAKQAGLALDALRGVASDGASGLSAYLSRVLDWVNHQRCVFHLWRGLAGELRAQSNAAAQGLVGAAARAVQRKTRRELVGLVRAVLDASSEADARLALAALAAHAYGAGLAVSVGEHLDAALVHLLAYNRGLVRASPEWLWRDFRLRLSHGRNHGSDERLERAALVWAIYHNFTPAQVRSERKRTYRRPGRSPLELAGCSPGPYSYLDALSV